MIHLHRERCDGMRVSACGIRYELPTGDESVADTERGLHHAVDCPVCKQYARPLGTPIADMSEERFTEIARSCGHE